MHVRTREALGWLLLAVVASGLVGGLTTWLAVNAIQVATEFAR